MEYFLTLNLYILVEKQIWAYFTLLKLKQPKEELLFLLLTNKVKIESERMNLQVKFLHLLIYNV